MINKKSDNSNRVVITGMSVISSIGVGKKDFWTNLIKGISGISDVSTLDVSNYPVKKGGEVKLFNPALFISHSSINRYGRASQFAIAATSQALKDSGVEVASLRNGNTGIAIGTTMANIQELEAINSALFNNGKKDISDSIFKYPAASLAFDIARELDFDPLCFVIPTACAAGNYCIGYGYDLVRSGRVKHMICGGADPFSRITFTGFNRLFAVAPEKCQPFDKNRKGMMVGEGAGILILESLDSALRRNAHIYAEILGYGLSCETGHMTLPNLCGIISVMNRALNDAKLNADQVDYISAHGTGTVANDKAESQAINNIFDKRKHPVPVSSIKSMLGHTMGAASAIEAIACALTIENNILPPTINFTTEDPECNIDCVPNFARKNKVDIVLNNSFAFGGNNACLVLGRL